MSELKSHDPAEFLLPEITKVIPFSISTDPASTKTKNTPSMHCPSGMVSVKGRLQKKPRTDHEITPSMRICKRSGGMGDCKLRYRKV